MSKKDKLLKQFLHANKTFKWNQLIALLHALGFEQLEASGSRVNFSNDIVMIKLHKPHPGNEVRQYVIREVKAILIREKLIQEKLI